MKNSIRASVIYFMLIFIYKLFGDPCNNYWVNYYYWLVSSIYFMLVFIDVSKFCIDKKYKLIASSVYIYWGIMAILRIYLFFNIDKHYKLISSTDKLTVGAVVIFAIFIYLTSLIWHRK